MTTVNKDKESRQLVRLSLKQELLLVPLLILVLGLSVYALIAAPLMMAASIMLIIFCAYSLIGIGRRLYSRAYLVVVAVLSLVAVIILAIVLNGYIKDVFNVRCGGLIGETIRCADNALLSASVIIFYTLVPLAVMSILGLLLQLRVVKIDK